MPMPLPMPMQQRAPAFFSQLGAPPGLEMYYADAAPPREAQVEDGAHAAVVPYAPERKRSAPREWEPLQPARVVRSGFDDASAEYMISALDPVRTAAHSGAAGSLLIPAACAPLPQSVCSTVVTHEELVVDTGPDWSYLAHLSAHELAMLPACAEMAHDAHEPYDAEMQPVRAAALC